MRIEFVKPDCFRHGGTLLKGASQIEFCTPADDCRLAGNCLWHLNRCGRPAEWQGGGDRVIFWREGVTGRTR